MISLGEKQRIIIGRYNEGKSQREIARETGINRKTVSKYIKEYEEARSKVLEEKSQERKDDLIESIIERPKYNGKNRKKIKLNKDIMEKIENYLKENEEKRRNGQRKQQKKKIDIYEAIKKEGYDIGYTTICNIINKIEKKGSESYIKSEYNYGDVCEFDWGEVKIYIEGNLKVLQLAVFTSAKGNYRYCRLYNKQDTSCFQEAHSMFFDSIGNVYKTMVYDNMKVAVKKFVGTSEKEPTEGLLKMSIYYGFNFRFCNIRCGNEKGHVERSVEYVRRKAFAHRDSFESIEEANRYLEDICHSLNDKIQPLKDGKSANEILNIEKEYMLPKMPFLDTAQIKELRVDKYSTITIDTCHYSVPDNLVGKLVFVKIYSGKIVCYYEEKKIAMHIRKFGFNEWTIEIEHFLCTLKRKPGALASSTALLQADPRIQKIYNTYYIKREKEFIELLFVIYENGIEEVIKSIDIVSRISPLHISTEKIKAIVTRNDDSSKNYVSGNVSEITEKSMEMLNKFKSLIPESPKDFIDKVAVL